MVYLGARRKFNLFLAISVLVISLFSGIFVPRVANAVGEPTLVGGSNVSGKPGVSIPITDVQVSGVGNPNVPVHLFVSTGSLSMTTTTGITFSGSSSGSSLYFSGSLSDVNTALATLHFVGNSLGSVTLESSIVGAGQVYYPGNGHIYEVVNNGSSITANAAKVAADARSIGSVPGYLATITSSPENAYISSRLAGDGWLGASDSAIEGDWKWVDGPESGTSFWSGTGSGGPVGGEYSNWSGGEPNDSGGDEDCAEFYSGVNATWNDLSCTGSGLNYYVVEYGSTGNLPAVSSDSLTITVAADTINIASCPELRAISADPAPHTYDTINLTHNLDCSGSNFTPMFDSSNPFKGVINGNGHTISNLTIDNADYAGLIGYSDGGTISNLHLAGGSVTGSGSYTGSLIGYANNTVISNVSSDLTVDGNYAVGGLVGELDGSGSSITNSSSTGDVTGVQTVGGLIGYNDSNLITTSYATGNVVGTGDWDIGGFVGQNYGDISRSFATGNVTGTSGNTQRIGGFVGKNPAGSLTEDYALGNVEGYAKVGGFSGALGGDGGGNIHNSYARGNVTGNNNVGGFTGRCGGTISTSYSTGYVTGVISGNSRGFMGASDGCNGSNDFWDTVTSGKSSGGMGTGKNTTQMKTELTFTSASWDFEDIWAINSTNDGYPVLKQAVIPAVDDNDGASSFIESDAPNNGDANNDGTPDSEQANVTSTINPITGNYAVLESSCSTNSGVSVSSESSSSKDPGYDYPVGLQTFTLNCGTSGTTATVTQYFYGTYDPSKLVARKYNPITNSYVAISGAVLSNVTIGGQAALKIVYQITDGSYLDQDGVANGTIVDPSGPALNVVGVPNTGFGYN